MKHKKTFAQKFEDNTRYQLRKLTRSTDLYTKDVYQKAKLIRHIANPKGIYLMQPFALKNFSTVMCKHLEPVLGDNVYMFTLVTGAYSFGKDNWHFDYKKVQRDSKKILKGYSYIATVALEEFPKDKYLNDGIYMEPHVHGIIWRKLNRGESYKITNKVKTRGYRINPLDIRPRDIESAIQYSFKACLGGKRSYIDKQGKRAFAPTQVTHKSLYQTLMKFRNNKIYDFSFAGGKGKKILESVIAEIKNA